MELPGLLTRSAVAAYFVLGLSVCCLARVDNGPVDASCFEKSATSPNGLYRFVSAAPGPKGEMVLPQNARIVFTLARAETGEILWTREKPTELGIPGRVHVSDDGRPCLRIWMNTGCFPTSDEELVCLSGKNGAVEHRFTVLDHLALLGKEAPDVERSEHGIQVHWLRQHFLRHGEITYFVYRTRGGGRIFFDIENGRPVRGPAKDLLQTAEADDAKDALKTLEAEAERLATIPAGECCIGLGNSYSAVFLAAQLQLAEAIPFLRKLELDEHWGIMSADSEFNFEVLSLRRDAQLALRLLGEKPQELPCHRFRRLGGREFKEVLRPTPLRAPRAERVSLVRKGMTTSEVMEAIGIPDYVMRSSWEFEMDASPPFTLRVRFTDANTVEQIQRLTPPVWQRPGSRWNCDLFAAEIEVGGTTGTVFIAVAIAIAIVLAAYVTRRVFARVRSRH